MEPLAIVRLPSPSLAAQPGNTPQVVKAARDFEAVLLGSLLRSMQEGFRSLPGEEAAAGGDDYQYVATQALAAALADSGGLGIAGMIVRTLGHTEVSAEASHVRPNPTVPGR
jgi:Rod binding domain-containing protein